MPKVVGGVMDGSLSLDTEPRKEGPAAAFAAKDEAVLANVNRTSTTENRVADCAPM